MHIFKHCVAAILLCSVLGTSCLYPVKSLNGANMEEATNILINSKAVTTNQIGEGGEISEYSLAFSKLFDHPKSKELFLKIFKDSKTINGKVYALIALYSLDNKIYNNFKKEFKGTEMVSTFWYCERTKYPINKIFKEIESEDFLLKVLVSPMKMNNERNSGKVK